MFILAGGSDSLYPTYWQELGRVIGTEGAGGVILSCMFSRDPAERPEAHKRFDKLFQQYIPGLEQIIHASEDSFYDQIARADIIYLHGGSTVRLLSAIPEVDRFVDAVKGKIVVGSSAGANFFARYCYSPTKQELMQSTGILPIGVVVHYGIDSFAGENFTLDSWKRAATEVKEKLIKDEPILLLPEGQFTVIDS